MWAGVDVAEGVTNKKCIGVSLLHFCCFRISTIQVGTLGCNYPKHSDSLTTLHTVFDLITALCAYVFSKLLGTLSCCKIYY